jgi:4a-hydroxytetrahydrobiopterin dehydratase
MEPAEVTQRLQGLEGWALQGDAIVKEFRFKDFGAAFGFMTQVAQEAERRQHHPDWSNSYNKVKVSLTSHSAGGLTAADFGLAEVMNQLAREAA